MNIAKKISGILSKPIIMHYIMPALIIYLVIGTVAQKYIGLYEATKIFFASPILWLGLIPLPGFPVLISLLFFNLAFKIMFKSPWNIKNSGIIITHIGAMLLLLGGLFTALFSNEGYIDLAKGQKKVFVTDYHKRIFAILDQSGKEIQIFEHEGLKSGDIITIDNTPIKLKIITSCRNCKIEKRTGDNSGYFGMAKHMVLSNNKLKKLNEENMAGLVFEVSKSDKDNGIYQVLENVPKLPKVISNGNIYQLILRKEQRKLPFSIELIEFKREMHPGTSMAKAYSSRVRIYDGNSQWESLISMNDPLRYKGYTFFQSSFIATPSGDISVLAVVWNAGRTFPYISGILMSIGIIIHLFVRKKTKRKGKMKNVS